MTSRHSRYELPERDRNPRIERAATIAIYMLIVTMGLVFLWVACALAGIDAGYY